MNSGFRIYFKHLLIFTVILGCIALIFNFILPKVYLSPAIPFLFPFFFAASLLSFYYLLKSTEKRFIKFVNTFLLTIILKLFLYAGVMVAYVMINRTDAIPFMLGFFVLYLCYTIFEASSIIRYSQPIKPGDDAQ